MYFLITCEYITIVCSCIHSNDFPMGVAKRKVCGGVESFTLSPARSMCSKRGLDEEYESSTLFMYHRSPPVEYEIVRRELKFYLKRGWKKLRQKFERFLN